MCEWFGLGNERERRGVRWVIMRLYFCRNFKISNKRANRIKIMRFGRNMRHLAIPEWKQCYLDYEHLKIFIRLIKRIV